LFAVDIVLIKIRGFLGGWTVWYGGWIRTFRRTALPPSSRCSYHYFYYNYL